MADEGSQGKIYARLKKHIKHHRTRVLREVDDEQVSYMCGLCVTPGFGPRYDCTRCHLRIHHHCASRLQLSPPCFLHPDQHHMSLVVVGEGGLQCRACTGAIAGLHYQCTWHGLEARIHPLCLLLRFEPRGGQTSSSTVHWLHEEHPLKDLYSPKEYVCDGCGDAGTGRRLCCRKVDCDFSLHPYCSSLPRDVEQREPCFLCGPAGAAHGSFRTAIRPGKASASSATAKSPGRRLLPGCTSGANSPGWLPTRSAPDSGNWNSRLFSMGPPTPWKLASAKRGRLFSKGSPTPWKASAKFSRLS